MPSSTPSIERPYGWVVAYAAVLIMGVGTGAPYVVVVGLKTIAAEFGRPLADPSLCYALTVFGAGLGGVVMGRWADRAGVFGPAVLASCAIPLGAVLAARAQSMEALWAIHFLVVGFLGNGALLAPMLANASRWFDRRRAVAIALVGSGQSLAGIVWPGLIASGIARFGWRTTLLWFALVAGALMLPLAFVFRRPPPVPPVETRMHLVPGARVFDWPANTALAALSAAIFFCCVAMAVPVAHTVAFCTDLGFSTAHGARMLSLLLLAAFLSRIVWGHLADRIGGLATIAISSACQALALIFYASVQTLPSLYALSIGFGLAFGGLIPTYAVVIREYFPASEAGWRIGAVLLFGTIGMAVGAWVGGAVRDLMGVYRAAFIVALDANLFNLAIIGGLWWRAGRGRLRPVTA